MSKEKPKIVFVLGGPGAGKGTQCEKIRDKFGYHHLSAGDCLREERAKKGSMYGELIENHIRQGSIVPVRITLTLLLKKMLERGWWNQKFLIDGFPRNEDNLHGWIDTTKCCELQKIVKEITDDIKKQDSSDENGDAREQELCAEIASMLEKEKGDAEGVVVNFCLFFDCDEETMSKRIMKRAEGSGRSDDNVESMLKRFRTYERETIPIINYYRDCQKLQTVKADKDIDDVFNEVCKISW